MIELEVEIVNHLGLHARAAAQLVRLAHSFQSKINLERNDNAAIAANAKSILSVLNLAAAKGTRLKLIVEGVDEEKASGAVEEIFAGGFGEL